MPKVIAIDGPAGAGKSTVARLLAEKLGFTYLDTGSLYRAVTWYLLSHTPPLFNGAESDRQVSDDQLADILRPVRIVVTGGRVWVNDQDVTDLIRNMEVSKNVSMVSERRAVREKLLLLQRALANQDIVVEGRDMGTVVFPSAFLKLYLDADVSVRSNRRLKEFSGAGTSVGYDEVLQNLKMRDERDTHREIAPLTRARDAVYLDTTFFSTEEVVNLICSIVERNSNMLYRWWKSAFYRITWIVLNIFSALYFFRKSIGKNHVDSHVGPAILAANHSSHLDPPLVAVSMKRPLHFLAKRELTEIPVFGLTIQWLSAIPVRRGILDRAALDQVRSALAEGCLVLVFPEGTRSRDGEIHDAKAGFGKLVLESRAPVIPVRIVGSHKSFPPGGFFPRPCPVRVIFGEPFMPAAASLPLRAAGTETDLRECYEKISKEVMDRIRSLPAS